MKVKGRNENKNKNGTSNLKRFVSTDCFSDKIIHKEQKQKEIGKQRQTNQYNSEDFLIYI